MRKVNKLKNLDGVDSKIIGKSVQHRPIYAFHAGGYCGAQVIIIGGIHAREWITTLLVVELVKKEKEKLKTGDASDGIWFIPLCNPDGVKIALEKEPLWKANARGVDLNVNFDADWGSGAQNVFTAGSENYVGPFPTSEPETRAICVFTREVCPKVVIAYHSKGEVVYWGAEVSRALAEQLAQVTGYVAEQTHESTGGYCDWVSKHLGVPAVTVEVGCDEYAHPIGADKLPEILLQNKCVPEMLVRFIKL